MLHMYISNNKCPKIDPCATPIWRSSQLLKEELILVAGKLEIRLMDLYLNWYEFSIGSNKSYGGKSSIRQDVIEMVDSCKTL